MTIAAPACPETALALLFGPGEGALDTLSRAIADAGAGGNLGRAVEMVPQQARDAAAREITTAAAGLLDTNLIDMLAAGWREYRDLTSAARHTLAEPGSTELVQLVTHQVSTSQRPYVTVLVDGRRVATVQLGLSVVFDVSALLAKVCAGRLAAIHSGSCDITATLAIDDIEVASKRARLELPGEIALRGAIRLLPASDYPPGEDYAGTATAGTAG
jgi:hypothetical protein